MTTTAQTTSLSTLKNPAANLPDVSIGFGNQASFELMQRAAKLLCSSTLVPSAYRAVIEKLDRYGKVKERRDNPNALANAVVALNMSQRMGADPLMIMQNLYVIEGRPSWSSQFIVAAINGCGKFSPLRFAVRDLGEKVVEYNETFWENGERQTRKIKASIIDRECIAWAIERATNERLEGPAVTIEMAVKEGWYTKNGSKWQTMPDVMMRYRAASFFGRLYAPELLMGLKTVDEVHDIIEISPETGDVFSVTTEALRDDMKQAEVVIVDEDKQEHIINTETGEISRSEENKQPPVQQDTSPEAVKESSSVQPTSSDEPSVPSQPTANQEKHDKLTGQFIKEISSHKTSMAVDQWRAKHHNRVANAFGGSKTDGYLAVMDFAEVKFNELSEIEKENERLYNSQS